MGCANERVFGGFGVFGTVYHCLGNRFILMGATSVSPLAIYESQGQNVNDKNIVEHFVPPGHRQLHRDKTLHLGMLDLCHIGI